MNTTRRRYPVWVKSFKMQYGTHAGTIRIMLQNECIKSTAYYLPSNNNTKKKKIIFHFPPYASCIVANVFSNSSTICCKRCSCCSR